MTLCVVLRVKYDRDLARRVELYKGLAQGGLSPKVRASQAAMLVTPMPASTSTSAMTVQDESGSEDEQSSTEEDSSDAENERQNCGDDGAQEQSVQLDPVPVERPAASKTVSADDGVAAFASSYLRAANISDLVNMHASLSTSTSGNDAKVRRQQRRQQRQQQQSLLGGGRNRHASGSLVGGFAPSEWRGQ